MAVQINGTTGITTPKLDALDLELGSKNVVERVSNANGEYVRFADGTQICTYIMNVGPWAANSSASAIWTLPAGFISACRVSANGNSASPHLYNASAFGGTSNASVYYGGSTGATGSVELIAIGRWY